MANSGEPYSESDLIDPILPVRGLIYGGYSENRAFVYFKQGGFVPTNHVTVFQFRDGHAIEIFSAFVRFGVKDFEQLRDSVDRCEVFQ